MGSGVFRISSRRHYSRFAGHCPYRCIIQGYSGQKEYIAVSHLRNKWAIEPNLMHYAMLSIFETHAQIHKFIYHSSLWCNITRNPFALNPVPELNPGRDYFQQATKELRVFGFLQK